MGNEIDVISEGQDSLFIEHEGQRYQLECPGYRKFDWRRRAALRNDIRICLMDMTASQVEFNAVSFKLIRLGPV